MQLNLLWDFDGTLFDTYPAIIDAFLLAMNDLGHSSDRTMVCDLARVSLADCVAYLAKASGLSEHQVNEAFRRAYGDIPADHQPPFFGARELCEAIVSSGGTNAIVTHRGGRSVAQFLVHHRMDHFFLGWVTADDGLPRKPDPAMFVEALRRFDLDRSHTVAIGDRDIYTKGAQAAGLRAACLSGVDTRAGLNFDDFAQLRKMLIPAKEEQGRTSSG